jgi:hypothetical protein
MNSPPEDVLPYAPNWARQPGQRPAQQQQQPSSVVYDAFSDEENPSYREMAQMFSPQAERPKAKRSNPAAKMLVRFGAVVGVAGAALALFVGYVATQPPKDTAVAAHAERFKGVNTAVAAVQAAFTPSQASEESPAPPVVETPRAPEKVPEPASVTAAAAVATDRSAASPTPPPASVPEAAPPIAAGPPQVAALSTEPAPPRGPIPQLTAGELATLMQRGRRFIESGDFSSARPVYRRAAEAGYAEAALALGETYDPQTLSERGAVGISPNVEQARHWYERARDMGSLEAPTRLERLPRQ